MNLTRLVTVATMLAISISPVYADEPAGGAETAGGKDGDLFSIAAGTIEEPDIVCSQRIPVVGQKVTLSARVRGAGQHPVAVQFSLEAPGAQKVVLAAKLSENQDSDAKYRDYEAQWEPKETGFYTLTVEVDPDNKSGDPYVANNAASVMLPVTWTELHIISWMSPRRCRWVGTATFVRKPQGIAYWRRRGTKALGMMYCRGRDLKKLSAEQMIEKLMSKVRYVAEQGFDGYIIDELGSYPDQEAVEYLRRLHIVFDRSEKEYPDLRVYNWTSGALLPEEADMARSHGHILMSEAYPEYIMSSFGTQSFEQRLAHRIDTARNTDALFSYRSTSCTIIALGVGGICGAEHRPTFENRVRLYRRLAPESPGICYYPGGPRGERWDDPEINYQQFLDELTIKYFLKPVLMVKDLDIFLSDYELTLGKPVKVFGRVRNIGGMTARHVGARFFVRDLATGQRSLLSDMSFPEIAKGIVNIKEKSAPSHDFRVINGTRYPAIHRNEDTVVYCDRAIFSTTWTPKKSGYHAIELEVSPSDNYTVLDGFAGSEVAVRP